MIAFEMTIHEALSFGRRRLANSSSPLLDSRLLLQSALAADHAFLIAHSEERLTPSQESVYRDLVERASQGEPIPYLVGEAPFCGINFNVNSSVLIPRPETEMLVEAALKWAQGREEIQVVDVGTGSGCIAIVLALRLPKARIAGVDISENALAVARANAARHGVTERIDFSQGSLLKNIPYKVDLLIANLPYVTDDEWTYLDVGVKLYEPDIALRGGPDGLSEIRVLLGQAREGLAPGGAIFLEIGLGQGRDALRLAQSFFPRAHIQLSQDLAGLDRTVTIIT